MRPHGPLLSSRPAALVLLLVSFAIGPDSHAQTPHYRADMGPWRVSAASATTANDGTTLLHDVRFASPTIYVIAARAKATSNEIVAYDASIHAADWQMPAQRTLTIDPAADSVTFIPTAVRPSKE
jgi:hypothetical protein